MRHYKERPCPGCGKIEKYGPQHLCQDCQRQLRLGKKREKEIAELEANREVSVVAIGERFIYNNRAQLNFLAIEPAAVLEALVRLAGLESAWDSGTTYQEAHAIHYVPADRFHTSRPMQFVFATSGQIADIELVLDFAEMVIAKAYEEGHCDGRSLIRELATAGVEDINRMATGK